MHKLTIEKLFNQKTAKKMQRRKINVLKMYFIFTINGLMPAGLDMK